MKQIKFKYTWEKTSYLGPRDVFTRIEQKNRIKINLLKFVIVIIEIRHIY